MGPPVPYDWRTGSGPGCGGHHGRLGPPDLNPYRMHVVAGPVLGAQIAFHPGDVDLLPHHPPAGRLHAEDRTEMSDGDLAVLSDQITLLDFPQHLVLEVREAGALHPDD